MASSSRAGGRAADTASASQPGDASSRPRGSASASQPGPVQLQRCPRPIVQMPYGWLPDRCNRCRRLTMWFGCGAPWNDIALANCCMVCSLEMAVEIKSLLFDQRAVVDTMCAKDEQLPVQVLRDRILGALILRYAFHLEYGSRSPKLCEEHVQGHIWMRVLRGKYDWNFDCGEAVCDPFSGFFGVNSVNLVGRYGRPVQLQVLFGTKLPKKHRTRDLFDRSRKTILHLVIQYLGPFQPWMIR